MVFESRSGRAGRWGAAALLTAAIFVLLYLLALVPSAEAWGGSAHGQKGHRPPRTYLALGDSLAFGYSQARFEENLPSESPTAFETGYVNDFAAALRLTQPSLRLVNDGCPGETTESMIDGPCLYQLKFPLHHPYAGGATSSQLADALAYIATHRHRVSPITIDIGANDALGVVEGACSLKANCIAEHAPALFAEVGKNLGVILERLRNAAPHSVIVVLGLYNPFGSSIEGGNQLTAALNEVIAADAAGVHAAFADPLPLFNPPGALEGPTICMLTNMCMAKPDIHPTDVGYEVLGGAILRQYLASLPGKGHGHPR